VISGFIMTWLTREQFGRAGAAGPFLVRRAIRIVPAYWFFTTLMVAAVLLAGEHVRHTSVTPDQLVTSYSFIPWPRGDGKINPILSQGWTLNYEAFFYLAFAGALLFRRGLVLLVTAFVALAALHPLVPEQWFIPRFYTAPIILEFLGGIALARIYAAGVRLPLWGALLCAAAGVATFILVQQTGLRPDRVVAVGIPALLVAASFILSPEPERAGLARRALQAGGDASYTIYLSHTFTINAVTILWRAAGLRPSWAGVAVGCALSLAAALIFYRLIERPVTEALQRRARGRPAPEPHFVAP
jgi:peptidoglycan/LPS O-acetylase OafA/YrhL